MKIVISRLSAFLAILALALIPAAAQPPRESGPQQIEVKSQAIEAFDPRNVSRKQAMEMLLTGEPIPAARAREIGLVNRVVAPGTERDAAIALAEKVALKSAYTVKLGKEAFYRQAEMSLADAYRYAAEVMTENMMARDAEEGIGAFIEKREPKWRDE